MSELGDPSGKRFGLVPECFKFDHVYPVYGTDELYDLPVDDRYVEAQPLRVQVTRLINA